MNRVFWAQSASRDLNAITDYLDDVAPDVRDKVIEAAAQCCGLLIDYPYIGEALAGSGLRKLAIGRFPYIFKYKVVGSIVTIIRVHHTAEDWRHP